MIAVPILLMLFFAVGGGYATYLIKNMGSDGDGAVFMGGITTIAVIVCAIITMVMVTDEDPGCMEKLAPHGRPVEELERICKEGQ